MLTKFGVWIYVCIYIRTLEPAGNAATANINDLTGLYIFLISGLKAELTLCLHDPRLILIALTSMIRF